MGLKPILFNTEMVRAILDGRKTVTRRVLKPQPPSTSFVRGESGKNFAWSFLENSDLHCFEPKYKPGDILYVRETWAIVGTDGTHNKYGYKADNERLVPLWCPSIHMPKEAARIFMRVANVMVERLQDITEDGIRKEGIISKKLEWLRTDFADLWNNTIKQADFDIYGWSANPWVWVIEFERIIGGVDYSVI